MNEATTAVAGKTVLVTGSSGGIGKATAMGLAGMGGLIGQAGSA